MALVKGTMVSDGSVQLFNSMKILSPSSQPYGTFFQLHYNRIREDIKVSNLYNAFIASLENNQYNPTITVHATNVDSKAVNLQMVLDVNRIIRCLPFGSGSMIHYVNTEKYKNREVLKKIVVTETINAIYLLHDLPSINEYISYGSKYSSVHAGELFDISIDNDFLYICVQTGTAGNAIWKKTALMQSP